MRILAESVRASYLAIVNPDVPQKTIDVGDGETVTGPESFPDDGYLGEYIVDIAQEVYDDHGEDADPNNLDAFKMAAQKAIFADIESTMQRMGIRMDTYFTAHSLYASNRVCETLDRLREIGRAHV